MADQRGTPLEEASTPQRSARSLLRACPKSNKVIKNMDRNNSTESAMSLCAVCTQIPWRTPRGMTIDEKTYIQAFARLESVAADRFQWADGSGRPVKPGRDYWPYIRNSDDACRFCQLVTSVVKEPDVQPTYHGGFRLKKKEFYGDAWKNKGVWTQLLGMRDERPIVRVWVGDERPEHFVRSIEAQTTFGMVHSLLHVLIALLTRNTRQCYC